jgi:hypothetical protein
LDLNEVFCLDLEPDSLKIHPKSAKHNDNHHIDDFDNIMKLVLNAEQKELEDNCVFNLLWLFNKCSYVQSLDLSLDTAKLSKLSFSRLIGGASKFFSLEKLTVDFHNNKNLEDEDYSHLESLNSLTKLKTLKINFSNTLISSSVKYLSPIFSSSRSISKLVLNFSSCKTLKDQHVAELLNRLSELW